MPFIDVVTELNKKMYKEGKLWFCTDCEYTGTKGHVYEHVEAKHVIHGGYQCQFCNKVLKTQGSLRVHNNKSHKQ